MNGESTAEVRLWSDGTNAETIEHIIEGRRGGEMTIPQRYECYNANIEPRSDGRFLFFADAREWVQEKIALLKNEHDEALRKSVLDQKQCDEMTSEAARLAEEIAALKESFNKERAKRCQCEFDGSECYSECKYHGKLRGEIATLTDKLQEAQQIKCFYGEHYAKTYRELEAENETLRTLIDGVTEIVEMWAAESPAQKVWKADWLAKAKGVLK